MRKLLLTGCALAGLAMASSAWAQTPPSPPPASPPDVPVGKQAGTLMVRLRAIGVLPQNSESSVSGIGGHVDASNSAAPEVDLSYFFTDNIAAELIAATTRHDISAVDTVLGRVNVGSVWVLPPTVTLQYHFMPKERFSPYLGAGLNASFFYGTSGAHPLIQSFNLTPGVGPAIQAGFDYNLVGPWFLNLDVKQIFVRTTGEVHALGGKLNLSAHTWLNPTVVGFGVGYRF